VGELDGVGRHHVGNFDDVITRQLNQ
jgi:hypothetical protein